MSNVVRDRSGPMTLKDLADLMVDPSTGNAAVLQAIQAQALDLHEARIEDWKEGKIAETPERLLTVSAPGADVRSGVRLTDTTRIIWVLAGRIVYSEYKGTGSAPKPVLTRTVGLGQQVMIEPGKLHSIRRHTSNDEALILDCRLWNPHRQPDDEETVPLSSLAEDPDDYYYEYDECYGTVYQEGAPLWETAEPNAPLVRFLDQFSGRLGRKVIDLGCGEGRDSIYLAQRGFDVVGIDVSRAALDKARDRVRALSLTCTFLEWDVLYLESLPGKPFDFAINMGCLHMLSSPEHRKRHLNGVFQILKPGGLFLVAHCRQEWLKGFYSVPHYEEIGPAVTGRVVSRRIRLATGGVKWIDLPTTHFKESSEDDLTGELAEAGLAATPYAVFSDEAFGNTAVLVATRLA